MVADPSPHTAPGARQPGRLPPLILPAAIALAVALAQPGPAPAEITRVDSLGITVRDSLSQGIVLWAVNAYWPSGDWEALVHRLQFNRPEILETAFGEEQAERLAESLQDLHVRILDGVRGRIIRGALRRSEWNGLYEVSLTVLRFQMRNAPRTRAQRLQARAEARDQGHPGVEVTLSTRFVLRAVETGDRLTSEVIAARRTRRPGTERIKIADLLEETIRSAYKSLAVTYDSLSASSADR